MTGIDLIDRDGFAIVHDIFTEGEAAQIAHDLGRAVEQSVDEAVALRSGGVVYGARNVLEVYPAARDLWRRPALVELLSAMLGRDFGLVRALFFDKPPGRSWSLAWHKDLTIAVAEHRAESTRFTKPTMKAGVPHVEAPRDVLDAMLTLRIHLDDVTAENGPLRVIPGSHRSGKQIDSADAREPVTILARCGDVLAMRPLLVHASGESQATTPRHRRVLHLEFAASPTLDDGHQWHTYIGGHVE